jgi:hypothetical protein
MAKDKVDFGSKPEAVEPVVMAKTQKGKEIQIRQDRWCIYRCEFVGGGELPESLKGGFTTKADADRAIQIYLATR